MNQPMLQTISKYLFFRGTLVCALLGSRVATAFDYDPVPAPQVESTKGAMGALYNGADAIRGNPAGLVNKSDSSGLVKHFYVPMLRQESSGGASAFSLLESLTSEKKFTRTFAQEAKDKGHQFARLSLFPHVGFERLLLGPIYDNQTTSIHLQDDASTYYASQVFTGGAVGISVGDNSGKIGFGFSVALGSMKNTSGIVSDADLSDEWEHNFASTTSFYRRANLGLNLVVLDESYLKSQLSIALKDAGAMDLEHGNLQAFLSLEPTALKGDYYQGRLSLGAVNLNSDKNKLSDNLRGAFDFDFGKQRGAYSVAGIRGGFSNEDMDLGANLRLYFLKIWFVQRQERHAYLDKEWFDRASSIHLAIDIAID